VRARDPGSGASGGARIDLTLPGFQPR
jgi:hypothetical protein